MTCNYAPCVRGRRSLSVLRAVCDDPKRGTLDLSKLSGLVLDEADEMLRMGFIEDVETIMAQIPEGHQTALFFCNHAGSDSSHYPPLYERAAGSAHSVQRDYPS